MKIKSFTITCITLMTVLNLAYGLQVFHPDGKQDNFTMEQLRKEKQYDFTTERFKHDKTLVEEWEGLSLQEWLSVHKYSDFQSIRFESDDNYMVRIHRAELDSMPGYIALFKDKVMLDSTELRLIFPGKRDMFWVRGITRIYLEDFKPVPPPHQIYIWDALAAKLRLSDEPLPFIGISGYFFDDIMKKIFCTDEGSVVLISRDSIKLRLDYPRHLKGAVLERTLKGDLNLKSPIIPAGMWLKDIVYMQCGPYAIIRQDYLYRLPLLNDILNWQLKNGAERIIRASANRQEMPLEDLALPHIQPFETDDWIELIH